MQYGTFDDEKREYVITNPRTPVKWINYIGTLNFGGIVDHTGGSIICKGDPSLNRITRYNTLSPASDFRGETLYIRRKTADGYRLFSPFYVPCLAAYEKYECHVGLGYTRYCAQVDGIEVEVTVFVPTGSARELRDIRIRNLSGQPVELDAIPVVEYTHFDALKQLTNADWVPQTMQSELIEDDNQQKILTQCAFMMKKMAVNYFTSNQPVSSFETERRFFLGDNEYGTWANPLSLQNAELSNSLARRGDNIGALMHHLGVLQPGESRRLITQLGQEPNVQNAISEIRRFRNPAEVDRAFEEQLAFWNEYLDHQQVKTPDAALNSMLNIHNPRQCFMTYNWSRYLSLYQLGFGSRGIGVRDSSQDVMGVLAYVPELGRALIEKILQVQRRDGSSMHQFNPLNMVGSEGDALERDDRPHYYGDDHLWPVLAVAAYVKETGDLSFLEKELPFNEKDRAGNPLESGTVYEHMQRALEFTHENRGAHGLPLLGFADWNDTINLPTGSESCFNACLYGRAVLEMIEIARKHGDFVLAEKYERDYAEMKEIVNREAWDGEWYVNYFTETGEPMGSKRNEAGQIYAYGQAWAVLSGFAPADRAQSALAAVYTRLNTECGIKLSAPGFNGFDPRKGGITTYPPGAKENGGIFLHINPWVILAETMQGNGERAYRYYSQINPAARNDQIERYECEPYVYPQNILADEHPQFGLARNSWLSGTASWMMQVGTQYLLGVRPEADGLRVDPCIPAEWDGFELERQFRGGIYQIKVSNPGHISKGVQSVCVDGEEINGNLVPVKGAGKHLVEVILG